MLRKTKMSNLCGVGKCAEKIPQKAKWDTPNGKMGYPKWQNGTSQMVKWDTPNGVLEYEKTGFRASEQGCRGGVLGVQGLRNGGLRPSKTPKIVQKGEKGQSILQF